MYNLLVRLMAIAALAQFGMTISDLAQCRSRACVRQIEKHSLEVLNIEWRPISVWPEEAKRLR